MAMVEDLMVTKDGREMKVSFRAVTNEGETIDSEVIA